MRLSKIARPAALLLADATAQGAESRLVAYGVDEKQSGFGFGKLGFLLNAVPLDAWVIIAILALMMVQSWVIMYRKNQNVGRVSRANGLFRERFAEVGTRLELLADDRELAARLQHSSLWRLYQVAVKEIRTRREQGADTSSVSAATIEAIRASMDGVRTKENQQLGSRLSSLSNAIAGGPYIGLLGTVLGIMVVFLGTAMAGDVNINAIARAWPPPCWPRPWACSSRSPRCSATTAWSRGTRKSARTCGCSSTSSSPASPRCMAKASSAKWPIVATASRCRPEENAMASVNSSHDDDDDGAVDSINITPLVDVLMVVLVMFILTATAQVAGIQINLPKASATVALSQPKTKAISVNDAGQVFLDAYPVTLPELEDRLRTEKALNPDFPVVVRGDATVQYQKVIEVLDLLRRLELSQVGLVTGKPT
ncbi:Biopolymer transport protein exbD [Pseudomonas aeruginosa]|nr:Biopolymer transport protein exbD [Pseudomonas aeruginosa]